ncbi:hypothetical protein ACMGD3_07620 [Lysinibacillus sphaericus]|uniref:hypothetical protein n=1 Tax=Lysinibacillus sphaericus TaxID=1421 RepID=UPI003F798B70
MIKKIIFVIIKIILFIAIDVVLIMIDDFLGMLFLSFILFYYTLKLLVWGREKFNKEEIENRLYKVKNRKMHYSMFTWLGEEMDTDLIIYDLIGEDFEKTNTIESIKLFKRTVEIKVGEDLTDYYALRDFIQTGLKSNFSEYLKGTVGKLTVSAVLVAIIPLVFKNNPIPEIKLDFNSDLFISIIYIILYFFIFITFISIIYNMFIKPRRRAKLLLSVLNIIIQEKETKSSTSTQEDNT